MLPHHRDYSCSMEHAVTNQTTPAAEALEAVNLADECYQPETLDDMRKHFPTIRTALTIYNQIQRGDTKELAEMPTEAMIQKDSRSSRAAKIKSFRSMWFAAPPHPATENTVEGKMR